MEMMMSNRQQEERHDRFTPKKVLIYCIIVGLICAIPSIFIDGLRLLSMASFVFASIQYGTCLERNFINGKREEEKNERNVDNPTTVLVC
jgi:hypothetical protein